MESRFHQEGYPEDVFTYKQAVDLLYDYDSTVKVTEFINILRNSHILAYPNNKLQTSKSGKEELHKIMVKYMKISQDTEYKKYVLSLIATLESLEVPILDEIEEIQRDFKYLNDRFKENSQDSIRYTYILKKFKPDS